MLKSENIQPTNLQYGNSTRSTKTIMRDVEKLSNPAEVENVKNILLQGVVDGRNHLNNPVIQRTMQRNEELANRIGSRYISDVTRSAANKPTNVKITPVNSEEYGSFLSSEGINLNWNRVPYMTNSEISNTGFHEAIHSRFRGNSRLDQLKNDKLFKNDVIPYLDRAPEGIANSYEVGRAMGLKFGDKYPGLENFKKLINNFSKNGPVMKRGIFEQYKLETPRDYKRVWDAITGNYYIQAGTAGILSTSINREK